MRKLGHPIAVFIVIVLAVIGIGVGVLAAQGPPKGSYVVAGCRYSANASVQTYGPRGSRFAAEFPVQPIRTVSKHARVRGIVFQTPESLNGAYRACIDEVIVEPTASLISHSHRSGKNVYNWAREAHWKLVSQDAGPPMLTSWQVQPVGCNTTGVLPGGCSGYLIATDGPTVWLVEGIDESPGPVRAFLSSFRPIG